MSISRRKILGLLPALSAGFIPVAKADPKPLQTANEFFGHRLHDDVSVSLLTTYARSLALIDEKARWEAQMMFHEGQLARQRGGTLGHKLGYRHKDFVEAHEEARPIDKSSR
jgi:hypothetical protein